MASTVTELLRRRFGGKKDILPSGYTQLKWLTSDARAWIDSGVLRSDDTSQIIEMETDIIFNVYGVMQLIGTDNGCYWGIDSKGNWCCDRVAGSTPMELNRAYHVKTVKTNVVGMSLFVDNSLVETSNRNIAGFSETVKLFCINRGYYILNGSMGHTKIFKAHELVRYFIPCINPNNIYGMFDLVTREFYTSASVYPFTGS